MADIKDRLINKNLTSHHLIWLFHMDEVKISWSLQSDLSDKLYSFQQVIQLACFSFTATEHWWHPYLSHTAIVNYNDTGKVVSTTRHILAIPTPPLNLKCNEINAQKLKWQLSAQKANISSPWENSESNKLNCKII